MKAQSWKRLSIDGNSWPPPRLQAQDWPSARPAHRSEGPQTNEGAE